MCHPAAFDLHRHTSFRGQTGSAVSPPSSPFTAEREEYHLGLMGDCLSSLVPPVLCNVCEAGF